MSTGASARRQSSLPPRPLRRASTTARSWPRFANPSIRARCVLEGCDCRSAGRYCRRAPTLSSLQTRDVAWRKQQLRFRPTLPIFPGFVLVGLLFFDNQSRGCSLQAIVPHDQSIPGRPPLSPHVLSFTRGDRRRGPPRQDVTFRVPLQENHERITAAAQADLGTHRQIRRVDRGTLGNHLAPPRP